MNELELTHDGYAELVGVTRPQITRAVRQDREGRGSAEVRALRRALLRLARAGVDVRRALEEG